MGEALKGMAQAVKGPRNQDRGVGPCQMPPQGPESLASSRVGSCVFRPEKVHTLSSAIPSEKSLTHWAVLDASHPAAFWYCPPVLWAAPITVLSPEQES